MAIDRLLWDRARWNIHAFASDFLGIEAHPGQDRFFEAILTRDAGGWRPCYLNVDVSAGNRAGKTLALAIVIAHSCLFKLGMRPPNGSDPRSKLTWLQSKYEWWHFGIKQEVADLVHNELAMIFAGVHPAQKGRGCPLSDMAGAPVADFATKDSGTWPMVRFAAILGGAVIRFRTTSGQQGTSALGRDMHGISFDECGFEEHLPFIVDEVLHLRRLGTGGQLILISTPTAGITAFADHWDQGDPAGPDRLPGRISLRMSTRDNVGYGIDRAIFERLVADMTPDLIPQNIDGFFIRGQDVYFNQASIDRAFKKGLPVERPARPGRVYVQGVDPAGVDRTWSMVFDVTWRPSVLDPNRDEPWLSGVKCSVTRGQPSTPEIVAMAVADHDAYSVPGAVCDTGLDTTGHGGHMFREQMEASIPAVQPVEFGGSIWVKRGMLSDVRTLFDLGHIEMPAEGDWLEVRRQFRRYKLQDRKIEQDAVMTVSVAVKTAKRARPLSDQPASFDLRYDDGARAPTTAWEDQPFRRRPRSVKRDTMTAA